MTVISSFPIHSGEKKVSIFAIFLVCQQDLRVSAALVVAFVAQLVVGPTNIEEAWVQIPLKFEFFQAFLQLLKLQHA